MKKATSILLLFCLVLTFAACSADKGAANYTGGETAGSDLGGNGGARIFTPRQIPLPDADSRAMRSKGGRQNFYARAGRRYQLLLFYRGRQFPGKSGGA